MENNFKFEEFLDKMGKAQSEEEKLVIKQAFDAYYLTIKKEEFAGFLGNKEQELRTKLALLKEQANTKIVHNAVEYPLSDWVTIRNYCLLHGVKESALSNRIRRGSMPKEAYLELPNLNNLKLIKKDFIWG